MTENFDKIVKFKKKRLWDFFPYRPPLAKGDQTHTPLSPLQPPPGPWLCPRNAISPLPLRRSVHATEKSSKTKFLNCKNSTSPGRDGASHFGRLLVWIKKCRDKCLKSFHNYSFIVLQSSLVWFLIYPAWAASSELCQSRSWFVSTV